MSGQGAVRLTAGEREALSAAEPHLAIGERSRLMRAVEAIVAARVASALDEVERIGAAVSAGNYATPATGADAPLRNYITDAELRAVVAEVRAAAPVPPADETGPQAGAGGVGGGGL